jgi:hypothetical protein
MVSMETDSWWAMLGYAALFSAPWVVAIAWLTRRTQDPGDGTPPPSMGELARRRMGF